MVTGGTDVFTSDTVGTVGDDDAETRRQTQCQADRRRLAISRTCSTCRVKARVCWSSPTRSRRRQLVVAVTAVTITNAVVTAEQITSVGEFSGTSFQGTFDHTAADIPAIKGTFTCTDSPCSLVTTGSGDDVMVTTATGYTFSGRREGVTAVEAAAKADYLLFGVWLDEADNDAGADTFGAIATGGQPFTADNA